LFYIWFFYSFFLGQILGIVLTIKMIIRTVNLFSWKNSAHEVEVKDKRFFCPACLFSITVLFVIGILVYKYKPINYAYSIAAIADDLGTLSDFVIMLIVIGASSIICIKHYWRWIYVAPFIVWFASNFERYSSFKELDYFIINGLFFLFPIIPIAYLVQRVRLIHPYNNDI